MASQKYQSPTFLMSDVLFVSAAGAIVVAAGLLQRSLGDIQGEEARLPPAAGAKARRESQRSKRFLKRNPGAKK
jgi:hypothetical protein